MAVSSTLFAGTDIIFSDSFDPPVIVPPTFPGRGVVPDGCPAPEPGWLHSHRDPNLFSDVTSNPPGTPGDLWPGAYGQPIFIDIPTNFYYSLWFDPDGGAPSGTLDSVPAAFNHYRNIIVLSPCPGYFTPENPNCVFYDTFGLMRWELGNTLPNVSCSLEAGVGYYMTVMFADPDTFVTTCPDNECTDLMTPRPPWFAITIDEAITMRMNCPEVDIEFAQDDLILVSDPDYVMCVTGPQQW